MTTEDAFHTALDADWDDQTARLVLADWLGEQSDERENGYRALAANLFVPMFDDRDGVTCWFRESNGPFRGRARLPDDWLDEMQNDLPAVAFHHWINYATRREAENAAARAFRRLPTERQADLLATA